MAGGVLGGPAPRYFSISSGRPFLQDLAGVLTRSLPDAGFELADATIYLPTRRGARALVDAFVETAAGAATLTPKIKALGDIEEDVFALDAGFSPGVEDELVLAPPIASAERRLVLARLIAEKDKTWFDGQRRWAGAVSAADELGKLLDSLYTEEIDPAKLQELAPDHLARHWRESLEFLEIVTEAWPAYLAGEGLYDPAARRVALISLETERWKKNSPSKPIIIAGTTGSTPVVARMIKVVASLPYGCVVLPGLDLASSDEVWDVVDEPHPQSGLRALLASLEISRVDVRAWPASEAELHPRAGLLNIALRPAAASDDWRDWADTARDAGPEVRAALEKLSLIEARDEEREATAIALKFRETLETPGRTAMLVTPDRDLARRVGAKMLRWEVRVDDSAGAPFANTPCGVFLRLVAQWLCAPLDPVRLMAMLDHPLFGGGLGDADRDRARRRIDIGLRGLRPVESKDGVRKKLGDICDDPHVDQILKTIEAAAARWPGEMGSFADRYAAHLAAAELLSASDDAPGEERLWRGDDGEAGAVLLAQLQDGLGLITHDKPGEYPDIFTRLIAGGAVRRRAPTHPRLSILGPLEARLQTADVVILAGLNEGIWPRDAAIDPFLSRPMRRDLGLPSPERRIGLAAHDFAQLAAAPEVVLTRAGRAGGKPTKPSRWIVRLKNILKGAGLLSRIDESARFEALVSMLDRPEAISPIAAPQPKPPVAARPTALSVTQVEKLLRDPYAIYAAKVLRLKKLDPLGQAFDQRYLGMLLHEVLEAYARVTMAESAEACKEKLTSLFAEKAPAFGLNASHEPFWRQRATIAFGYLAQWDASRRQLGAPVILEGNGEADTLIDGASYRLKARADRIDKLGNGDAFIIDYKSGRAPSLKQVAAFSPQLPLTAVIVELGGFEGLAASSVAGFEYVQAMHAGGPALTSGAQGVEAAQIIAEAREGLVNLFKHFANPEHAYPSQPRPQFMNDYGDYDHLARRKERAAQGAALGAGSDE
ncbi:MAG: double-strand break repair protein AddB [Pseudomonadota bacterium]